MRHLIGALLLTLPVPVFAVEPLEAAAKEAATKCRLVGVETFYECANLQGKGDDRSAARKSVIRVLNLRTAYVQSCQKDKNWQTCIYEADWLLAAGLFSGDAPSAAK